MTSPLRITRFRPLAIKIEDIGPFRGPFELSFLDREEGGEPCNLYLLVSRNGYGKTTVLEVMTSLMWLLGAPVPPGSYNWNERARPMLRQELRTLSGRAQLDSLVDLEKDGRSRTAVVSVFCGSESPLRIYTPSQLDEVNAALWLPLGSRDAPPQLKPYGERDSDLGQELLDTIRLYSEADETPASLFDQSIALPTLLLFTAERQVMRPPGGERAISRPQGLEYGTAHTFSMDGATWANSLDGLLVWYEWLGRDRFDEARELINKLVFVETDKHLGAIDRHNLSAVVEAGNGRHGISELSHGERSLMQILLRTASHMSGCTIVLIDELDLHLHPTSYHRFLRLLKSWVQQWPGLAIFATTHQPSLIKALASDRTEEGLVKGGHIIDPEEI